jgi:hypothetical protein
MCKVGAGKRLYTGREEKFRFELAKMRSRTAALKVSAIASAGPT